MKLSCRNLSKVGRHYCFRLVVPERLRGRFGRREIKQRLRTGNLLAAATLAMELRSRFKMLMCLAGEEKGTPKSELKSMIERLQRAAEQAATSLLAPEDMPVTVKLTKAALTANDGRPRPLRPTHQPPLEIVVDVGGKQESFRVTPIQFLRFISIWRASRPPYQGMAYRGPKTGEGLIFPVKDGKVQRTSPLRMFLSERILSCLGLMEPGGESDPVPKYSNGTAVGRRDPGKDYTRRHGCFWGRCRLCWRTGGIERRN